MFVQRGGAASNEQLSTLEILATSIGRIPRQEGYLARKDTSPPAYLPGIRGASPKEVSGEASWGCLRTISIGNLEQPGPYPQGPRKIASARLSEKTRSVHHPNAPTKNICRL